MPAPKDFDEMWAWLKREIKKAKEGSSFSGTGMHPNGQGGIDSDNFDPTHGFSFKDIGDAEFNGNVDIGGTLNVTGNTVIGGTLSLPEGIVDNDALANPLQPATAHADAQNFSASTSWQTIMTVNVTVPAGFTRALILSLNTSVTVLNGSASEDWIYCSASIPAYGGALPGWVVGSPNVPAGKYGTAFDYRAVLLEGLSGSFSISGQVITDIGTWPANISNKGNLDASILFLR